MVVVFAIAIRPETILLVIIFVSRNSVVSCDALSVFGMWCLLVHHAGGWRRRLVAHGVEKSNM